MAERNFVKSVGRKVGGYFRDVHRAIFEDDIAVGITDIALIDPLLEVADRRGAEPRDVIRNSLRLGLLLDHAELQGESLVYVDRDGEEHIVQMFSAEEYLAVPVSTRRSYFPIHLTSVDRQLRNKLADIGKHSGHSVNETVNWFTRLGIAFENAQVPGNGRFILRNPQGDRELVF